ncbi:MAG: MMPL family transporter [Nocardioidaceae bacterium]|nr:MMPL family transporter [Nocardioidaceae bacterium]
MSPHLSRSRLAAVPTRAARGSATHPWRAIGAWVLFVAIAVSLAATVSSHNADEADYRVGESGRAAALLEDAGLDRPPAEHVLITARTGTLDDSEAKAAAEQISHRMADIPGVLEVGAPIGSPNGTAVLVPVELTDEDVDPGPLLAATNAVQADHPNLTVAEAGEVTINEAINDRVAEDLHSAEFISLPITLLLMLLAFGALIAAGLPVLLAATSVAATIGIAAPISHLVPAEDTVMSMIVLIGMAVGVDYSLFYLKRERQERAAGRSTLDAVAIAAETSGHAILVSGGAVIAALAGLFVLTDTTFNSLAVGSILVVATAVLGSITVLPALLVKLGRWVDRPRVPLLWRLTRRAQPGSISGRVLGPVVRHPVVALVVAGLGIAALAVPALGMKTHQSGAETLPGDIATVQTLRAITADFPSEGTAARVVLSGVDRTEAKAALSEVAAAAGESEGFDVHDAQVETSADGRTSVVDLPIPYAESDDRATDAIEHLREDLIPQTFGNLGIVRSEGGIDWAVGADAAASLDHASKQGQRLPFLIGFVLLLTMVMMIAAFRSVLLGVVSTVLNLASVGVAFGVLSLVFQHGMGEGLLDFTSPGFVIDWIPIFVLVVLVGLSMDYHVFVLSRIRELVDSGLPARDAVHRGIADTAGVITSAAAVMVSVFSIFATLSMMEMKMMGVGLAAAILIDATVIRLVVLPAVLVLLGERAWPRRRRPQGPTGTGSATGAVAPTEWVSQDGDLVPVR